MWIRFQRATSVIGGAPPRLTVPFFVLFLGIFHAQVSAQTAAPRQISKYVAITEQEAKSFADRLTKIAKQGDVEGFNDLIDWNAVFETATKLPRSCRGLS